jgi:isoleucyl-tRNA synthetase
MVVAAEWAHQLEPYKDLLQSEINVRSVAFSSRPEEFATTRYSVNARKAGPRLGSKLKAVLAALKAPAVEFVEDGTSAQVKTNDEWVPLLEGEWDVSLQQRMEGKSTGFAIASLADRKAVVALDVHVTADLESEGHARDVVRVIQQKRKETGLRVTDRIWANVVSSKTVREAVEAHAEFIKEQTLSNELVTTASTLGSDVIEVEIKRI